MKIEITKTNGTVYPHYIATQEEKIEFREQLEHGDDRQDFKSAVVMYGKLSAKTIQGDNVERPGARFETEDFNDLLAELGKFGV